MEKYSYLPFTGLSDLVRKVNAICEVAKKNNDIVKSVLDENNVKYQPMGDFAIGVEVADIEAAGLDPKQVFKPSENFAERIQEEYGIINPATMDELKDKAWRYDEGHSFDDELRDK